MAKFKGGYSSDASLVFQSWLKDIRVYTIERRLSQWEAIQLVKDYTSEQARSEVEYYLGLTPRARAVISGTDRPFEPRFPILWDCPAPWLLTFITGARGPGKLKMPLQMNCKSWSGRSLQGNWNLSMRPTRHWNISLPRNWGTHISEWWPGDSACLSLTPKSFTQFTGRLALMFNSWGETMCEGKCYRCSCGKWGLRTSVPTIPGRGRTKSMPKQLRLPKWRLSWTRLCKENKQLKSLFSPR